MEHPGQDQSAREELCVREDFIFFWGPEATNQELRGGGHICWLEMLLDFAMPFISLSKLYKNEGQNHFADSNAHVLTFFHPILIFQATY
jgi:hypothetical protein